MAWEPPADQLVKEPTTTWEPPEDQLVKPWEPPADQLADPNELAQLKASGQKLSDAQERILFDKERETPLLERGLNAAQAIGPALYQVGSDLLGGLNTLRKEGIVEPVAVALSSAGDSSPEKKRQMEYAKEQAANAFRSFGSGAVQAQEDLQGSLVKAFTGGSSLTDAINEVSPLPYTVVNRMRDGVPFPQSLAPQTPDQSFENRLTRTRFSEALDEDRLANPDRMATGLSNVAQEIANSQSDEQGDPTIKALTGMSSKDFFNSLAESAKEQARPIDPQIASLGDIFSPTGPEALAIGTLAKAADKTVGKVGETALKATTAAGRPIEGTGKFVTGVGTVTDAATRKIGDFLTGNEDTILRSTISQPIVAATRVPGRVIENTGKTLTDISRQIDVAGPRSRRGLLERAARDSRSGTLVKNLFGSWRGRAADNILRNADYLKNSGVNGALVGTVMGIPDIESSQDLGAAIGSGIGVGLASSADPQNYRDRMLAERRNDEDADIYRVRSQADPETLSTLDQLHSKEGMTQNFQNQILGLDARIAATSDPETKARLEAQKQTRTKQLQDVAKMSPADVAEMNRIANLEFADVLDLAHTTGRIANMGDVGVQILSAPQMASYLDKLWAPQVENAKAVVSLLEGRTGLTPDEQASVNQARSILNGVEDAKRTWSQQRGLALSQNTELVPGVRFPIQGSQVIINGDLINSAAGMDLGSVLRHETLHTLRQYQEVQDMMAPITEQLFDQKVTNLDGTTEKVSSGIYSDADLDKMAETYAKLVDPSNNGQAFIDSFKTPDQLRDYMREELLSESMSLSVGEQGMLRSTLDEPARAVLDSLTVGQTNKALGLARNALLALGVQVDGQGQVSDILGTEIDPRALALLRQFQRGLRDYQGALTFTGQPREEANIPLAKVLSNRALQERYKDADFFQKELATTATAPDGTKLADVLVSDPAAKVGTWTVQSGRVVDMSGNPVPVNVDISAMPDGTVITTDNRIARHVDGTPKILTKRQIDQLSKKRNQTIREAIDNAPNDGTANRLADTGKGSYRGIMSPSQVDAINNLPDSLVPPTLKQRIIQFNDVLGRRDGSRMLMEYQAALRGGKYRSLAPRIRDVVPIGFQFSKDGNFLATNVSVSRMFDKLNTWAAKTPGRLNLWGRDQGKFWDDLTRYLENHRQNLPGETGLDMDPQVANDKKNIINDFFNLFTKDTEGLNPDRSSIPAKKGQDSVDRVIMSSRLDRILALEESNAQKLPVDYGRVTANFMPNAEAGITESSIPFYSQLQRTISDKMPERASKQQIKAIIDPSKGSGVKAEEVKWSGLEEWLDGQGEKISKADILNHLQNEGQIQFTETRQGKQELGDDNSRFSKYVLPGGENYREVILSLPVPEPNGLKYSDVGKRLFGNDWTLQTSTPEMDAAIDVEFDRVRDQNRANREASYTSSHFPDIPNYVAHMRLNDRVDSEGNPGLMVEEFQSDRFQQARKEGFTDSGGTIAPAPFSKDWPVQLFKRALAEAVNSGSPEWDDVTQPQRIGEISNNLLGRELSLNSSLSPVEASVLPLIDKYDQIRRMVINNIPVDVVDDLSRNGFTPGQFISDPNMVGKSLPLNLRTDILNGVRNALVQVATGLRASLSPILTTERDGEFLPTLKASVLSPREIVRLFSPVSSTNLMRNEGSKKPITTSSTTEFGPRFGDDITSTELANFLNNHDVMVHGRSPDSIPIYRPSQSWIGIADGQTQVDRFDLSKQVEKIKAVKNPDGTFQVSVIPQGQRSYQAVGEPNVSPEALSDMVGKELAERIVSQQDDSHEYSGVDLKIGGEGMKTFYDKILPNEINKYIKKWGGKVDKSTLPSEPATFDLDLSELGGEVPENRTWREQKGTPIHRIDITPQMRESVKSGQPQFMPNQDYMMSHRPNPEGPRAHNLIEGGLIPEDIYDHPEWYAGEPGSKSFKETVKSLRAIKGKPDAMVKIYRASPREELNDGDWVSLSKTYVKQHGMADDPRDDIPVHEFTVPAKDLRWAMDDLQEFGYFPNSQFMPSASTLDDLQSRYDTDTFANRDESTTTEGNSVESAIRDLGANAEAARQSFPKSSERELEERALEQSFPRVDLSALGEPNAGGVEHDVWLDPEDNVVYKATKGEKYGNSFSVTDEDITPLQYLQRMRLQNEVFGDDVRVEGYDNSDGIPRIVTSQPFISSFAEDVTPTMDEIAGFLSDMGFEQISRRRWYRPSDRTELDDAHVGNFVLTEDGDVVPIDVNLRRLDESTARKLFPAFHPLVDLQNL